MRNIKFRAWDTNEERMILPEYSDWEDFMIEPNGEVSITYESGMYEVYRQKKRADYLIIEQFTGLQDSKGVDIYEGDIVRCIPIEEHIKDKQMYGDLVVVWDIENATFYYDKYVPMRWGGIKKRIIIGNIHDTR
jgi:uncharacterized phage protein (TIGR01671 family)